MTALPEWYYHEIPDWVDHFQWLGVAGARSFLNPRWAEIAEGLIEDTVDRLGVPEMKMGITSGGALGIDSIAEAFADEWWYRKCIFPPKNKRWAPDGFEARNELIGQVANWILGIRCESTRTWGTGHMCEYADSLGKPVERYVIHANPLCEGCQTDETWKVECYGTGSV